MAGLVQADDRVLPLAGPGPADAHVRGRVERQPVDAQDVPEEDVGDAAVGDEHHVLATVPLDDGADRAEHLGAEGRGVRTPRAQVTAEEGLVVRVVRRQVLEVLVAVAPAELGQLVDHHRGPAHGGADVRGRLPGPAQRRGVQGVAGLTGEELRDAARLRHAPLAQSRVVALVRGNVPGGFGVPYEGEVHSAALRSVVTGAAEAPAGAPVRLVSRHSPAVVARRSRYWSGVPR